MLVDVQDKTLVYATQRNFSHLSVSYQSFENWTDVKKFEKFSAKFNAKVFIWDRYEKLSTVLKSTYLRSNGR